MNFCYSPKTNPTPATGVLKAHIALIDCAYAWIICPLSGCCNNAAIIQKEQELVIANGIYRQKLECPNALGERRG